MTRPLITGYNWAPDEARGLVRDMRVRWALEEVGQPYDVRHLNWGEQKTPAHRARQPFGQVPTYEEDGLVLHLGPVLDAVKSHRAVEFHLGRGALAAPRRWVVPFHDVVLSEVL